MRHEHSIICDLLKIVMPELVITTTAVQMLPFQCRALREAMANAFPVAVHGYLSVHGTIAAIMSKHMLLQDALRKAAKKSGLPYYLVCDAGKTQIPAGSHTVLAIGPGLIEEVDALTGDLRLL